MNAIMKTTSKEKTTSTAKSPQIQINKASPTYWRVTFDNPPLNLMGPEFIEEFREIITDIETDATSGSWCSKALSKGSF
jgi:enoyl-CoA hydratase/carnithine racemase